MGKRVLVADDSATIQKAFAMVFGGLDVSLIPARSLDEAISAARQGRPDLVIADANLGGRTGYELCAAVKADPGLRGTPVYILASTHTPYDEAKGREAGADGHLQKPFESQGIIDRVNDILARVSAAPVAASAVAPPASAPARAGESPPVASAFRPVPSSPPPQARRRDDDDDDYGEVVIERAPVAAPAPAPARAAAPAAAVGAGAGGASLPGGLRPSLIPGARPVPGGMAARPAAPTPAPPTASAFPARPATAPPTSPFPGAPAGGPARPAPVPVATAAPTTLAAAPAPAAPVQVGRTMMGMPAVMIPGVPNRAPAPGAPPGTPGMPAAQARAPGMPAPAAPGAPLGAPPLSPPPANQYPGGRPAVTTPGPYGPAAPNVSARVEQKLAAFAARGPEYEAIAKLSREVIEEVVWEVVPELAEVIIREHIERLAVAKK